MFGEFVYMNFLFISVLVLRESHNDLSALRDYSYLPVILRIQEGVQNS